MGRGNLNDFLKPGQILPPNSVMIEKSLEILELSPHGQQLVNFVRKKGIAIQVMSALQAVTYLPEKDIVYVGFNRSNPVSPTCFILMLAGILREAQQEAAGIKHPRLHAPLSEHLDVSVAKYEDKVWYMCAVATELNEQPTFTEYKFLDELRKMGHDEALELFTKQKHQS